VTVTVLMPGPTGTAFFERAGMEDTKLGAMENKDDPAEVARQSDLHLYEVLGPFIAEGDILGHEPMGVVDEVGGEVTHIAPGDRVVIPFNISCGHCFMCDKKLYAQCETTQVREQGMGAALFGYTKLYGQVPGGQAQFLRVPQAHFGPVKVPGGPPDERFVYLSDVLPTAWQAVDYAAIPSGGSVTVFGLGPIGQMSARIARHRGYRVISRRCTRRSRPYGAGGRCRSAVSTAERPTRFPCCRCSTRAYSYAWARHTSSAGSMTSCRWSPTRPIPLESKTWPPIACLWRRHRVAMRSSRRRRTARSKSCSPGWLLPNVCPDQLRRWPR
jgi:hypothetical protein